MKIIEFIIAIIITICFIISGNLVISASQIKQEMLITAMHLEQLVQYAKVIATKNMPIYLCASNNTYACNYAAGSNILLIQKDGKVLQYYSLRHGLIRFNNLQNNNSICVISNNIISIAGAFFYIISGKSTKILTINNAARTYLNIFS